MAAKGLDMEMCNKFSSIPDQLTKINTLHTFAHDKIQSSLEISFNGESMSFGR